MALSVVSVGAHQDDELSCLGTLIRCADRGDRITTISISNGNKGRLHDLTLTSEEITQIRIGEASAVASALGGTYHCLGLEDEYVEDTKEIRVALTRLLREVQADIVLTCPPTDYQEDHIRAGAIASHAAWLAGLVSVDVGAPALEKHAQVFYFDSICGLDFQPVHYVDVSEVFERKLELLRLHASQNSVQPHATGWNLIDHCVIVNRFRGLQSNVAHAEGFRPLLRVPMVRTGNPLP